ncbi:hypothetical protein SynSYN20_02208 [Synechococcus sp. SYN20]|nr:hypothetical protein SynSYN20_02208 [Synechococcus sp. SYN20]
MQRIKTWSNASSFDLDDMPTSFTFIVWVESMIFLFSIINFLWRELIGLTI